MYVSAFLSLNMVSWASCLRYSEVVVFAGESLCMEIADTDAQLFFQLTTA